MKRSTQLHPAHRTVSRLGHLLAVLLMVLMAFDASAKDRVVYFHNDALGSPVAATDESGQLLWREAYAAYGKRLLAEDQGSNQLWYTGKEEDPTLGLQDFGARWYDPNIGRFLAIDSAGFDEANPQSFNRYAYANNNPYRYVDPDGEVPLDTVWDALNVGYDLGKAATGFVTGNSAMVAEGLGDAAADGAAMLVPYMPAGTSKLARAASKAAGKSDVAKGAAEAKTVLGHFPEYKRLGDSLNARIFNIPEAAWNKMSEAERWGANQKFLDRMISRGDEIVLATPLDKVRPGSYFARELEYMGSKGYVPSADGTRLIKP